LKLPVYINSIASVSPLGKTSEEIWENYKNQKHFIKKYNFSGTEALAAFLQKELKEEINELRISSPALKNLDESVLFSVFVAREAVKKGRMGTQ